MKERRRPEPGPTGRHFNINEADAGELRAAMYRNEKDIIIVEFGTSLNFLAMNDLQAVKFAIGLLQITGIPKDTLIAILEAAREQLSKGNGS